MLVTFRYATERERDVSRRGKSVEFGRRLFREGLMPKKRNEFAETHKTMKAWVAKRDREGWSSQAEERSARRVLMSLWACANNDPVPPTILKGLAEDSAALAKARKTRTPRQNVRHPQ
jgi:hypothetical protein